MFNSPPGREELRSLALFAGVDAKTLEAARAGAFFLQLAPGETSMKQGDDPKRLFAVASGCVKLAHVAPDGTQILLGYRHERSMLGCACVMRPMPYVATARAVEPTTLLGWSAQQVESFLAASPAMARNALRLVCEDFEQLLGRLRELSTEPVEQRLARALRGLARPRETREPTTPPISRQDLAELTGATHFTISRILAGWETTGIVRSKRPRLFVADPDRLGRIAEGA